MRAVITRGNHVRLGVIVFWKVRWRNRPILHKEYNNKG